MDRSDVERLLDGGVERGIIDSDQRAAILALDDNDIGGQSNSGGGIGDEERFRFVRSFDDVFLAIGAALLIAALAGANFLLGAAGLTLPITAIIVWGVAEIITAQRRRSIPSILLSLAFSAFVGVCLAFWFVQMKDGVAPPGSGKHAGTDHAEEWMIMFVAGLGIVASSVLFYVRFRLPFTLAQIAVAATLSVSLLVPGPGYQSFLLPSWCILLGGVASFAMGMRYDFKDPDHESRFSDCAFWLHIAAAPMIVHGIGLIFGDDSSPLKMPDATSEPAVLRILVTLLAMTIIALIVDRRALVVSGLVYLGTHIIAIVHAAVDGMGLSVGMQWTFLTLGLLGVLVIGLSLGWRVLRKAMIGHTPLRALVPYIPAVRT